MGVQDCKSADTEISAIICVLHTKYRKVAKGHSASFLVYFEISDSTCVLFTLTSAFGVWACIHHSTSVVVDLVNISTLEEWLKNLTSGIVASCYEVNVQ